MSLNSENKIITLESLREREPLDHLLISTKFGEHKIAINKKDDSHVLAPDYQPSFQIPERLNLINFESNSNESYPVANPQTRNETEISTDKLAIFAQNLSKVGFNPEQVLLILNTLQSNSLVTPLQNFGEVLAAEPVEARDITTAEPVLSTLNESLEPVPGITDLDDIYLFLAQGDLETASRGLLYFESVRSVVPQEQLAHLKKFVEIHRTKETYQKEIEAVPGFINLSIKEELPGQYYFLLTIAEGTYLNGHSREKIGDFIVKTEFAKTISQYRAAIVR